jgi:hypothetical protein
MHMSIHSNPGLDGNPHFTDVNCLSEDSDRQTSATLTLAYETRTATLVTLFAACQDVRLFEVDYTALANEIIDRLQLPKEAQ